MMRMGDPFSAPAAASPPAAAVRAFRGERQRDQPDQKGGAHGDACVPERLRGILEDHAGEQSERGRPAGRHEAADVVAETGSRATKTRREQLGEIDRIAAEQGQLGEAHERDQPEDLAEVAEEPEDGRGGDHGRDQCHGKRRLASESLRRDAEGIDAEKRPQILHHRGDAGPERQLARNQLRIHALRDEPLFQDRPHQVEAEEADAPDADDTAECQQQADHRATAVGGVATPAEDGDQSGHQRRQRKARDNGALVPRGTPQEADPDADHQQQAGDGRRGAPAGVAEQFAIVAQLAADLRIRFASSQRSGSRRRRRTSTTRIAGTAPTTNIHRHAAQPATLPSTPVCSRCPRDMLVIAAETLPTVDSAWSRLSA